MSWVLSTLIRGKLEYLHEMKNERKKQLEFLSYAKKYGKFLSIIFTNNVIELLFLQSVLLKLSPISGSLLG